MEIELAAMVVFTAEEAQGTQFCSIDGELGSTAADWAIL